MSGGSVKDRLRRLIDCILGEERSFQERARLMRIDQRTLDDAHHAMVVRVGHCDEHERLRAAHEAMFKVHRKIFREHQRIVERCRHLSARLNAGFMSEQEMVRQCEHLAGLLKDIRCDHERMECERQQILRQHQEMAARFKGFA